MFPYTFLNKLNIIFSPPCLFQKVLTLDKDNDGVNALVSLGMSKYFGDFCTSVSISCLPVAHTTLHWVLRGHFDIYVPGPSCCWVSAAVPKLSCASLLASLIPEASAYNVRWLWVKICTTEMQRLDDHPRFMSLWNSAKPPLTLNKVYLIISMHFSWRNFFCASYKWWENGMRNTQFIVWFHLAIVLLLLSHK